MSDKKEFTEFEDNYIKEHFPTTDGNIIARVLGRDVKQVWYRARKLGVRKEKYWTDTEIQWLKENYSSASWDEIISNIHRTKETIIKKASRLGVKRVGVSYSKYTDEDRKIIEAHCKEMSMKELQTKYFPNRTVASLLTYMLKSGIHIREHWTDEEDEIIIDNYKFMDCKQMTSILPGRTREAIYNRMRKLGLKDGMLKKYSDDTINFIRDNWENMSDGELGEALHKAPQSIKEFRRKMGLYRQDPSLPPNYKSILRYLHANNSDWKKRSMERCNYKCVLTGEPFDDIHHTYAKSLILCDFIPKFNLPDDFDINTCDDEIRSEILEEYLKLQDEHGLGLCLTKDMHKLFHIRYGFGLNTPDQFIEFVEDIAPDRLDYVFGLIA